MTNTFDVSPILAIETAADTCSVALEVDGEVHVRKSSEPRSHAKTLLGMIDQLLQESGTELSGLAAIAVSVGPGSFTGIRIGISVAQGLAYAQSIPIIPCCTLKALAMQYYMTSSSTTSSTIIKHVAVPVLDARMSEVYWSVYRVNESSSSLQLDELLPPQVSSLDSFMNELREPFTDSQFVALGPGWKLLQENHISHDFATQLRVYNFEPSAEFVLHAARVQDSASVAVDRPANIKAMTVEAQYVRDQVSWKKRSRRRRSPLDDALN